MAKARVSALQVKEIITTEISETTILASMIDTANLYIDTHLSDAGHTDAVLAKIELYLAAHFIAITDDGGALRSSKLGDSEDSWDTSLLGEGFKSTLYGQTALNLDTSGILANKGLSTLKAEFRVL